MKLYQRAVTGKILWTDIRTEGPALITEWGEQGTTKPQITRKVCTPMNVGRSNATTAEEQAVLEMEAKITKKKKEGYVTDIAQAQQKAPDITLDRLPRAFCPTKPVSKTPKGIVTGDKTYAQRKRNGHCIILVKTESEDEKIYSRRMETLTEYLDWVPSFQEIFAAMPPGTMVLTEYCYVDNKTGKDYPRNVAKIVRRKSRNEAINFYEGLSLMGKFECIPFDVMFYEGSFIGATDYLEVRYEYLKEMGLPKVPETYFDWRPMIEQAKKDDWEGFVLRVPGSKSHIHYTLNGKAARAGAYKFKFLKEEDFIITGASMGKSGKHAGMLAQFYLSQYNEKGDLIQCGKCGPGKLTHEQLKELTEDVTKGEITWPQVVEIEYQSRHSDSLKLEFPQFVRLREDKSPEECIVDNTLLD